MHLFFPKPPRSSFPRRNPHLRWIWRWMVRRWQAGCTKLRVASLKSGLLCPTLTCILHCVCVYTLPRPRPSYYIMRQALDLPRGTQDLETAAGTPLQSRKGNGTDKEGLASRFDAHVLLQGYCCQCRSWYCYLEPCPSM